MEVKKATCVRLFCSFFFWILGDSRRQLVAVIIQAPLSAHFGVEKRHFCYVKVAVEIFDLIQVLFL